MAQCRKEILGQLALEKPDLKILAGVHGLCYARVNEEDTLAEFGIRRNAFLNQQDETGVLMWMVVLITISGVVLAGLQLVAGFRLASLGKAAFEQGGQFVLETKKVSLNSSVTGVLVLAISLCFFYVFAKEIYLIRVIGDDLHSPPTKSISSSLDMKSGWDPSLPPGTVPADQNTKQIVPLNEDVKQAATNQKRAISEKARAK